MRRPSVGDRRGRWTLLHELDASRMSCVFLARDAAGHLAALKVPLESELFERFANEVRVSERVQSAFTARVLDSRVEGPEPFVAFEYVQGPTLREQLRLNGPKPDLGLLAVGLAEGLHRIHAAGIVHRDLKPSNVIITSTRPVIIDFGIARDPRSRPMTQAGVPIGTPGWLSPEQHRGEPVDTPSDIYGWGKLLAWGRDEGLSEAAAKGPTGISEELQEAITQALSDDPTARPTAPDLLARLAHEGQTVVDEVARSWTVAPVVVAAAAKAVAVSGTDAGPPEVSPPQVPPPPPVSSSTETPLPVSSPLERPRSLAPPPSVGGVEAAGDADPAESQDEPTPGRRRRWWPRLVASVALLLVVGTGLGLAAAGTAGDWFSAGPDHPDPDALDADQPVSDGPDEDAEDGPDEGADEDAEDGANDDNDDLGDDEPDPGMASDGSDDDLSGGGDGGARDDGGTSQLPDYEPDIAPPVPAHVQLTESGRDCEGGLCGCPASGSYSRIDIEHGEPHPHAAELMTAQVTWSGNAPMEGQFLSIHPVGGFTSRAESGSPSPQFWSALGWRQEAFLDISREYWLTDVGQVFERIYFENDRTDVDGRSYYSTYRGGPIPVDRGIKRPRVGYSADLLAVSHVLCYLQPATDAWETEIPVTLVDPEACRRRTTTEILADCYQDAFEWIGGAAVSSDYEWDDWLFHCHENCVRQ